MTAALYCFWRFEARPGPARGRRASRSASPNSPSTPPSSSTRSFWSSRARAMRGLRRRIAGAGSPRARRARGGRRGVGDPLRRGERGRDQRGIPLRGVGAPLESYAFKSRFFAARAGARGTLARLPLPLPAPYLEGLDWSRHYDETGGLGESVPVQGTQAAGDRIPRLLSRRLRLQDAARAPGVPRGGARRPPGAAAQGAVHGRRAVPAAPPRRRRRLVRVLLPHPGGGALHPVRLPAHPDSLRRPRRGVGAIRPRAEAALLRPPCCSSHRPSPGTPTSSRTSTNSSRPHLLPRDPGGLQHRLGAGRMVSAAMAENAPGGGREPREAGGGEGGGRGQPAHGGLPPGALPVAAGELLADGARGARVSDLRRRPGGARAARARGGELSAPPAPRGPRRSSPGTGPPR